MPEAQADLLRLLELAHPGRPQADLLAMIEATPDNPRARATGKPTDGHSSRRGILPAPQAPAPACARRSDRAPPQAGL